MDCHCVCTLIQPPNMCYKYNALSADDRRNPFKTESERLRTGPFQPVQTVWDPPANRLSPQDVMDNRLSPQDAMDEPQKKKKLNPGETETLAHAKELCTERAAKPRLREEERE
ncbi:UNVERIFIED_CONTAM: hypothetical protein FKN15_049004 [Acipenser sinensis]